MENISNSQSLPQNILANKTTIINRAKTANQSVTILLLGNQLIAAYERRGLLGLILTAFQMQKHGELKRINNPAAFVHAFNIVEAQEGF